MRCLVLLWLSEWMTSLMYLEEGLWRVIKESFLCREMLALRGCLGDLWARGLRYFLERRWKILVPT
jgi:hypothetical protein